MVISNDRPLKDVIHELIETYHLKNKLNETRLVTSWEKVTGKVIAKHTKSLYVKNRILYVKLDSAALRYELGFARQKIIDLLHQEAGERVIEDIVFT